MSVRKGSPISRDAAPLPLKVGLPGFLTALDANRIFADPAKIHRVRHHGRHYQVDAIHLAEPSPQRTPVLYQAGSSTRGREFAATHAECVFVFGADKRITRDIATDIRSRAAAHGRDPRDILIFSARFVYCGLRCCCRFRQFVLTAQFLHAGSS